ncbi:RNA polymerase sigma-54 factor [Romboutsia ilealis]|uniref:RNA polymerase factor sigma-54 n=1 Tax=Romboutsia faecis TaxID=2764597 RepID=A0ABR7JQ83_9FIRM|nr:RNA polymerase factor sigma-54 [Romboutsia faecis]MBC5997076.1 RNA polymerase factor sigma-54 [Romboutsia faecis]MRN25187.1 RNA polymerase sigma-54 factor [Romboutsia ilealis]
MNFNNGIELTQSQKLIMTANLRQSLEVLNMNRMELESEIVKELESNPLLDAEKNSEINWEQYIKDMENSRSFNRFENVFNGDSEVNLENIIKSNSNIYDDLKFQISLYKLDNLERMVCEYIIDSLDEDGYLNISDYEIIESLNIDVETFEECMHKVQNLEPSGVAARNLEECLIIQINNHGIFDEILESIIKQDLKLIASNKYKDICKKYKITLQECKRFAELIKDLNPKPCEGYFNSSKESIYVQPDVIVEKIEDEFIAYLNERDSYKLKINNFYKEVLKNSQADKDAKDFIKERLNSALSLIKNIDSRKSTILKIAEIILKKQEGFFNKGAKYINPMTMKEVAEELSCHESTISRGVNGKYMLTPFGTYEFKYFFNSSLENDNNEAISSASIKNMIRDKIKAEKKDKPLSDDKIAKLLKEEGINVARRTVAKYREELGILSSSKRKK